MPGPGDKEMIGTSSSSFAGSGERAQPEMVGFGGCGDGCCLGSGLIVSWVVLF